MIWSSYEFCKASRQQIHHHIFALHNARRQWKGAIPDALRNRYEIVPMIGSPPIC